MDSHRPRPHLFLPCVLVALMFVAASVSAPRVQADSVPLATYGITVSVDAAPPQTLTNTVAPNTVASITSSGGTNGGTYAGVALASTFSPLLVHVQGEANALETGPLTSLAEGSTIFYYLDVEETAPAPVDVIPLVIRSNLEADASASSTGEANAAAALIISDLNISHVEAATCNILSCVGSSFMAFIDSASATADQDIQVEIAATGDAGAVGAPNCCGGHATFQAIADPTIQIDPSFAYADDFTIVFSPNLTSSAAAPEPPAIDLLAIGLIPLIAAPAFKRNRSN